MSRFLSRIEAILLVSMAVVLSLPCDSRATWTQAGQFTNPVGCGFFFDANNGMIGTGIRDANYNAEIWVTSNGGASWQHSATPDGTGGAVTDIFMQTATIGYASVIGARTLLWETVDGGHTWTDATPSSQSGGTSGGGFASESYGSTCVYAVGGVLVLTQWGSPFNNTLEGGIWVVGNNYKGVFVNPGDASEKSNGIDFADDLHGVVTMGPQVGFSGQGTRIDYYTTDGGYNWNPTNDLPESWGVYAVKGTSNFFSAGEGDQATLNQFLFQSTDNGARWNSVFDFSSIDFNFSMTGHIAGKGNTLYVQTEYNFNRGVYRSDDLGKTWKSVGGYSNSRDTRFFVTGCRGEVVYVFDGNGGVWKTTDGGDGTLNGGSGPTTLSISPDSTNLVTYFCQPVSLPVSIASSGCAPFALDSLHLTNDALSEFSLDTAGLSTLVSSGSGTMTVTFSPNQQGARQAKLEVFLHSGTTTIDTVLALTGDNITAPAPTLLPIADAKAGDTASITMMLQATTDTFQIKHLQFHINLNTDLLTPVGYSTSGTLSAGASNISMITEPGSGVSFSEDFTTPITEKNNLTLPLITLHTKVYLTKATTSPIVLDSFGTLSAKQEPLCVVPAETFTSITSCGDTTIRAVMLGNPVGFDSVAAYPDPVTTGGRLIVEYSVTAPDDAAQIEIYDASGRLTQTIPNCSCTAGRHSISFQLASQSGEYVLMLRSSKGELSKKFVIAR